MISTNYEQLIHLDPEFPIIFHCNYLTSDQNIIMHWHEDIELLNFREGQATVECDTVQVKACAGDLVIVNTCELHSIHAITPSCSYDCLILGKQFLESSGLPVNEIHLSKLVNNEQIRVRFNRIRCESSERPFYYKIAVKAEALMMITYLFRTEAQPHVQMEAGCRRRLDMVRAAILYIRYHYTEDITIDDICSNIGFSKYYFCRVFHDVTGKTVIDTINFLKCNYARELISSGRYNVSESAELCGFHNLSYFSKTYKQKIGELPSETAIL